jgi:hypothetical protein
MNTNINWEIVLYRLIVYVYTVTFSDLKHLVKIIHVCSVVRYIMKTSSRVIFLLLSVSLQKNPRNKLLHTDLFEAASVK